ncbi:MAG: DNA polymerase IV [Clostridia bacterium]|nr:DNA polymerase IV [Clostridia bacterium]
MHLGASEGRIFHNSNFKEQEDKYRRVRTVLHCDGNAFFASCEATLHPEYDKVPFAVCGSAEERHGIVLAKNELAKKYGVSTGETVWMAKKKCPSLLTVRPTYGLYNEISRKMNKIFYDYTDLVEPFGVDESWLDVTGSARLFGDGKEIADDIRARVKRELGITVSVGVSFNKVFAKLGSDLKKPDATTVIPPERFASVVWSLPVGALLFAGRSSCEKLEKAGIKTVGDLAASDMDHIKRTMGKNGLMLRDFALGRDFSEVTPMGFEPEPKSVSNGMTFRYNLVSQGDISFAAHYLSGTVASRLRRHGMECRTVAVSIRRTDLTSVIRQATLPAPTCVGSEIARAALAIIAANRRGDEEIYSFTVHAQDLVHIGECELQQTMFYTRGDIKHRKLLALESAADAIKERFGKNAVFIASALNNRLIGT